MKRLEDDDFLSPLALAPLAQPIGAHNRTGAGERDVAPSEYKVVGLFAGVGGLEEGFRQAGHHSVMLCEFDSMARRVLARRFERTELTIDVRALKGLPECDVLTAGFPCQDLSQVGRRKGIAGPNSGLVGSVFELLAKQKRPPCWVILENVPFMLALDRGNGIRAVTKAFEELGYAWAYRTIDARAFGLPQRRRRVILLASKQHDPRPVLLGSDAGTPQPKARGSHACGFYWTEGNTGLGWAIDAVPPLKGGSALHIPSSPAIWFPKRRLIATPAIEDAERLQGFTTGWTDISAEEPRSVGKRWRMVGNAVSVPMAKWLAQRLTATTAPFQVGEVAALPDDAGWPSAGWGMKGARARCDVSEWPVHIEGEHLAGFLRHRVRPLSKKATSGFLMRLRKSSLRYEAAFEADLAHHVDSFENT
ncbi:DNA cytosine methyltransferase [Rhizobium binxianense]|uniref:DNA cytosine methyltransferase n=1 Tax=Rhizobium binxianense TaxID=3024242 RepID=UPI00235FCF54|nr:DNA (cytosine-5-)-methyltransferase [Rhizobium sp. MJ37]MDC9834946.1 DNA (cytosine-5-)-methyltransferase [Rhizobium sp. MJ37]